MTITYQTLDNTVEDAQGYTAYERYRWETINKVEGFDPGVYYDTAATPQLTMGIGFNLNVAANRTAVMGAMGLDTEPEVGSAEEAYVESIRVIIGVRVK